MLSESNLGGNMTAKTIRSWIVHIKIGMNGNGEKEAVY